MVTRFGELSFFAGERHASVPLCCVLALVTHTSPLRSVRKMVSADCLGNLKKPQGKPTGNMPLAGGDFRSVNERWSHKGATSPIAHLEKLSLNFSSSSFVIRVNLLHP